jgi:murein DD-endopeptidase MepM/ murein hydrolase activator NlpD
MDTGGLGMRRAIAVMLAALMAGGCHPSTPQTFLDWGIQENANPVREAQIERKSIPQTDQGRSEKFLWPVEGKLVRSFDLKGIPQNAGIDIAVAPGTPIRASGAGVAVYVGSELASYGNLLLIEHSYAYVTAYAHAQRYTVKKGDLIERGQVVGFSGGVRGSQSALHFEIRRSAKPIDPLTLLHPRK